jgi:hypothetical protein
MNSMENFFKWMSKPIPYDEVVVWFSVHNMVPERVELYGDIFKSIFQLISDTYLGDDGSETKIIMSIEDKEKHFNWCWNRLLDNFRKENIKIKSEGIHKDYFWEFFKDTYYNQQNESVRKTIPQFINELFDLRKAFTKSDLDIITELYKALEKNIEK